MSSDLFPPIPADTAKVACSIFGRSNFYLAMGDQVNGLFSDLNLRAPPVGILRPSRTLAMLYLITIFQFLETLPDRLAEEALRVRIDWKYALHLPVNHPGLEAASFCEFRQGLLVDPSSQQDFQALLARISHTMCVAGKQPVSLPTFELLQSVCMLSRLDKVWGSIREAIGVLATKHPEWLRVVILPLWYVRYGNHGEGFNLAVSFKEQEALVREIGADGIHLLESISQANRPELESLPEILNLRQVWQEQYAQVEGKVVWRKDACAGCFLSEGIDHANEKANDRRQEVN